MIGLVRLLLHQRNYIPFACTTLFSFVIPIAKFILITVTLVLATCCRGRAYSVSIPLKTARVLIVICKYQLVDAFSVILLVTFINFVGISVEPLFAAQAYLAYCLLSIVTTQWLCHCYSETFERSKMANHGDFAISFSNPLLPRHADGFSHEGCTTPVNLPEGCTTLPSRKTAASLSLSALAGSDAEDQPCSSVLWHQQDIRQRPIRRACSPSPGYMSPISVSLLVESAGHNLQEDNGRARDLPRVHSGHLRVLWDRACLCRTRGAQPIAFLHLFLTSACQGALCLLRRLGWFLRRLLRSLFVTGGGAIPRQPNYHSSVGLLGSGFSRGQFSERLVRTFFLVLLLCVSTFALLVCWVRPILEVALVPGQQRGFAIETSLRSLGDVFWRLYSMGHVFSGCGIMVVFPVLATFILYAASIGTLVGECILQWSAGSYGSDAASYQRLADDSFTDPGSLSGKRRLAIYVTKTLSYISAFVGDLAMPDVQSIGLVTSYFIVNNIDFFGARLPGVPLGEPAGALDRLLWNFSGFWAMLAFGVSASQVHRISLPFEGNSHDALALAYSVESSRRPSATLSGATFGPEEHVLYELGEEIRGSISNRGPPLGVEGSSAGGRSELPPAEEPMPCTNSNFMVPLRDLGRKRKSHLFGVLLHGCIRIAVSLALLLPIWLQPAEVLDIDLLAVVRAHF